MATCICETTLLLFAIVSSEDIQPLQLAKTYDDTKLCCGVCVRACYSTVSTMWTMYCWCDQKLICFEGLISTIMANCKPMAVPVAEGIN